MKTEQMNGKKIMVTEMQNRGSVNTENREAVNAKNSGRNERKVFAHAWKKNGLIAMVTAGLLLCAGCGVTKAPDTVDADTAQTENAQISDDTLSETTQIANPFTEWETLDEAAAETGFSLVVPDTVDGYAKRTIMTMNQEMTQVIYGNEDAYSNLSDEEWNQLDFETIDFSSHDLLIRKAVGSEDISGDYNSYDTVVETQIDDRQVTMKGNGELLYIAIWERDGYSYAIDASDGLQEEEMTTLIAKIQ